MVDLGIIIHEQERSAMPLKELDHEVRGIFKRKRLGV
jgi:hypothetical protein